MQTMVNNPDQNDVVILELDRPRALTLSHRALKRFSALTGCALGEIEVKIQHYDQMSALLWILVTDEQIDLGEKLITPDDLDALLNKHKVGIKTVMSVCGRAIELAFAEDEEEGESEGNAGGPPLKAAGVGVKA